MTGLKSAICNSNSHGCTIERCCCYDFVRWKNNQTHAGEDAMLQHQIEKFKSCLLPNDCNPTWASMDTIGSPLWCARLLLGYCRPLFAQVEANLLFSSTALLSSSFFSYLSLAVSPICIGKGKSLAQPSIMATM